MTAPAEPVVTCANCGRAFDGRFCPDCGQEHADLGRPLRNLVRDLLSDTFAFDARIWRTLPLVIARPGALAAAYAEGRRARYVPPLRLYVFVSALFFGVMALSDGGPLRFAASRDGENVSIVSAYGIELQATGVTGANAGSMADRIARASTDVERLNDVVIATLSYVHFLVLPAMALVLWLLWRRRWYVEHLVFGMYFFAFSLLVGSVIVALYALGGNPHPESPASTLAIGAWNGTLAVMLYRALRDMYGDGRGRTFLKLLALVPLFAVLATGTVILTTGVTLLLVY